MCETEGVSGGASSVRKSKFSVSEEELVRSEEAVMSGAFVLRLADDKLLVCQFMESSVSSSQFGFAGRSLGNLSASLVSETAFQHVPGDQVLRHVIAIVRTCVMNCIH